MSEVAETHQAQETPAEIAERLMYRAESAEGLGRFSTDSLVDIKAPAIKADLERWLAEIEATNDPNQDKLPIDETGVIEATKDVINALDALIALKSNIS
jgi:hypothetical protein